MITTIQIVRHRATRRSVFGTMYVGDFEVFTLERRSDMLDVGSHEMLLDPVAIGDHPVTGDARKEGRAGSLLVGLSAGSLSLHETGNAMEMLKKKLAGSVQPIHVEVIDEINYTAVE